MPSRSEKQRKALYAKKGSKWVHEHHFDKIEKKPPAKTKQKRGR